tara:strand:- start:1951 stop:2337 length:387 start_codon:yes stop_codon:yes gene_type:complete
MDVVRLRTLTEKSTIWFGKWEGYSVGQMLGLNHNAALRWIYYNCDRVSFTDDILTQIRIIHREGDRKINKPGKDPIKGGELQEFLSNYNPLFKHIAKVKQNKRVRGRLGELKRSAPSKSQMASKNHGH